MLIYQCKNTITNRVYIGRTVRTLSVRKSEHLKELRLGTKGGLWQKDYDLYGESSLVFTILEHINSINISISDRERELILVNNTLEPNGYNKTLTSGAVISASALAQQSRHSLHTLEQIMLLAVGSEYKDSKEIADYCSVSENVVQDLLRCKSYLWLEEFFPELYSAIQAMNNSGHTRAAYIKSAAMLSALDLYLHSGLTQEDIVKAAGISIHAFRDLIRGKAYKSIRELNSSLYDAATRKYTEYNKLRTSIKKVINTTTGQIYEFSTCAEGARLLNVDRRRLSELLSGVRKQYNSIEVCS